MKTEDELDAEIAKLFDEVTTTKVEMVNGKPRISDQATLDQMEREEAARRMEEACGHVSHRRTSISETQRIIPTK